MLNSSAGKFQKLKITDKSLLCDKNYFLHIFEHFFVFKIMYLVSMWLIILLQ